MQDMRDEAIAALRDALRSTRTADRLRAAEAILRATGDVKGAARDAGLAELSDQALLEIARGVHHREMGPVTPSAETVPSRAHTDRDSRLGEKGTQNGPAIPETPPPGLVTPDNPFMKRRQKGPKEDPRNVMPGAPSPSEPEPWE